MNQTPLFRNEPVLTTQLQESLYFGNTFSRDISPESKVAYLRTIVHHRRPSSYIGEFNKLKLLAERKFFLQSLQRARPSESLGRLKIGKAQYAPDIGKDAPLIPFFSTLLEQSPQARKEVFSALTLWIQHLVFVLTEKKDENADDAISTIKQRLAFVIDSEYGEEDDFEKSGFAQLISGPIKTSLDSLIGQTCERQKWNLKLERYIQKTFIEANGERAFTQDSDILGLQFNWILCTRLREIQSRNLHL